MKPVLLRYSVVVCLSVHVTHGCAQIQQQATRKGDGSQLSHVKNVQEIVDQVPLLASPPPALQPRSQFLNFIVFTVERRRAPRNEVHP